VKEAWMKFATVRELSSGTSHILREVDGGEAVIVTKFGKPKYLLIEITEDGIEDYILAKHYHLEDEFDKGVEELKTGKTKSLRALLPKAKKRGR
jgi:antitoxin (DNA-binding transcriptional repressor) of toxin-antitoxin stability system